MNLLHLCCSQGYSSHVTVVLEVAQIQFDLKPYTDALVDAPDSNKDTALFYAIKCGHGGFQEIIQQLIRYCDCNIRDKFGKTALHYASELGQDDTLELMFSAPYKNKVHANIQDNEGKTALHVAIENG